MTKTPRHQRPWPGLRAAGAAATAAVLTAALLAAPRSAPAAAAANQSSEHAIDRGALLYRVHCANCHGDDGEGDGPMVEVLTEHPTDLTRLTPAGGTFPADEVRAAIDGREPIRGHGRQEMPVWGLTFRERGRDTDQEADVRGRIDDLIAFLRSIQEGEDAPASPGPVPEPDRPEPGAGMSR